ncbi:hypothetical protein T492DRAFT_1150525 [Pavlovales sp. CCMP2436]|nr:hypothetical protein T492DRAFT_1150525 [Pavlovales sp. CCMP2436]
MATPARAAVQVNEAISTAAAHANAAPEPSAPITVTEGAATLYFASRKDVFYNYVQCTNRDLSIIMTRVFADIRSIEAAEKAAVKQRATAEGGSARPAVEAAAPTAAGVGVAATSEPTAAGTLSSCLRTAPPYFQTIQGSKENRA